MSGDPGVVIVGAGQAALQLASSVRDAGFDGAVTLVGEEHVAPYQRPPLSKGLLTGATARDATALRADDFYRDRRIELLLGHRVEHVDRGPDGGGEVVCAGGRRVPFARLVLATGATPRRLAVPGGTADGVMVLRTLVEAEELRGRLAAATDVVVVGGGFIGLEVAATAATLGKRVTVLEAAPTILGRAVGPTTAAWLHDHHQAAGIRLQAGTGVVEVLSADGRVAGVRTTAAETIPAQLVVVGIGAEPRTQLAEQIGLEVDGGVVVDRRGVASDGTTLAVGDCAVIPDPTPWGTENAGRVRLESIDHAVEHAKTAAGVLLGAGRDHASVPWFWSDQGKAKLQIVGLRRAADHAVGRPSDPGRHVVGYYRDGRLVAAEVVNAPAVFMSLRGVLSKGADVPAGVFADPDVDLRRFAKEARGDDGVSGA